jgi:hypothetical protein
MINTANQESIWHVRFVPHEWTAPDWQELSSRFAGLVGAAMCSALDAVHMTAGHNALRGSGPDQKHAFDSNAMAQEGLS